jgi:hypothetical protein
MQANKFLMLVMLVVCFASRVFSENDPLNVPAPFVGKIRGLGGSIRAIQTTDGSYVTLSERRSGVHFVRKTKASGKRVWEKSLSIQIIGSYSLTAIAEVNTGYVIVGYKTNVWDYDGPPFALIVFLRPDGTVNWNRVFFENGGAISFDYVAPSPDGGFIVTGAIYPPNSPILVKFTSSGDILWTKRFDNLSSTFVSHPSLDNGLVLAAGIQTENFQLLGADLIKVDQSGRIVWRRTVNLAGPHSFITLGHTFRDGTILATNPAGSNILTLVGLNANGKLKWSENYSLSVSPFSISSVIPTEDGSYVVTGTTYNKRGESKDGFLIKIDAARNLVLKQTFGYPGSQDRVKSVFVTNANSYLLIGSSNTDLLFVNLNSTGAVPGCNFFHSLDAKRLHSPKIKIGTPTITESSPTFPAANTTRLILGASHRRLTTMCQ